MDDVVRVHMPDGGIALPPFEKSLLRRLLRTGICSLLTEALPRQT